MTSAGLQAVHWSDVGPFDASDSEIMAYATTHEFVVPTHDLDFSAILAATHGEKQNVQGKRFLLCLTSMGLP